MMATRDDRKTARRVGDRFRRVDRRLGALERGTGSDQLPHSSIEDGSIEIRKDGGVVQRVGLQSDGTYAVTYDDDGTAPAKPSTPAVSERQLALAAGWDGRMADNSFPHANVARVDIHASETQGFTPDGTTIVGSLWITTPKRGGGVVYFVSGNVTHYVKLVAVNSTDVASEPSDEVAATPLPAQEIEAGALNGTVITGATIRTADSGQRLELTSDPSNTLEGYDSDGNFIGWLTMQLTDSGREILALRGANDSNDRAGTLWQYPGRTVLGAFDNAAPGNSIGSLDIDTTSTGEGSLFLRTQDPANGNPLQGFYAKDSRVELFYRQDSTTTENRGECDLNGDDSHISYYNNPGGDDERAQMYLGATSANLAKVAPDGTFESHVDAGTGVVDVYAFGGGNKTGFHTDANSYTWITAYDPDEAVMADTLFVLANPFGRTKLYGDGQASALTFRNGNLSCENNAESAIPIYASDFKTASSREAKEDIRDLDFSALEAVRAAPSRTWRYRQNPQPETQGVDPGTPAPAERHVGPMAEDLPALIVDESGAGLRDQLGVLWQAVREQQQEIDDLRQRVEQLETSK